MKLNRLNLNYYSFGYLGGFLDKSRDKFTINDLIKFASKYELGGVEFPIDYLLKNFNDLSQLLVNNKMDIFISFENFSVKKIKSIVPYLKKNNIHKARIKMSNHFGGNRYQIKDFETEYISFLHSKHQDLLDDLAKGKLTDEIKSTLEKVALDLSQKYAN